MVDGHKSLTKEQLTIRELSDRIVTAQRPIQILDAIKWNEDIKIDFFKNKFKKLPPVTREYYQQNPLPYDPNEKIAEFRQIIRDINSTLGTFSGIGNIMIRMCSEYTRAIELIMARGTKEFSAISKDLYGDPDEVFYPNGPKLKDLARLLTSILVELRGKVITEIDVKRYNAEEAVVILKHKLEPYFAGGPHNIKIMVSDNIVADASAGADTIKIHKDAIFSDRDLRLLEVHEGWVHIGTTLNGMAQPICTFLSKGSPSVATTQEGLGVITEIITFSSYPERMTKITNRLTAIEMVSHGANFIDVFNYCREHGLTEDECYNLAVRVFRGSLPDAGPFAKDIAYSKGFILIYNYIRLAVKEALIKHIPVIFVGKTVLEDLQVLTGLMEEGLVMPPLYMPPQFKDLAALSSWMCFSLFLNQLDLNKIAENYKHILHH